MKRGLILLALAALAADTAWALPSATIQARPAAITYGQTFLLKGRLPDARAGQSAKVLAHACGFTKPVVVATVKLGRRGSVRYRTAPALNARYSIEWRGRRTRAAQVRVAPGVTLQKAGPSRYEVEVISGGGSSFSGKNALLQRRAGTKWRTIASIPLQLTSPATALNAVSSGSYTANVAGNATLRAVFPQSQAGRCYSAAASGSIKS